MPHSIRRIVAKAVSVCSCHSWLCGQPPKKQYHLVNLHRTTIRSASSSLQTWAKLFVLLNVLKTLDMPTCSRHIISVSLQRGPAFGSGPCFRGYYAWLQPAKAIFASPLKKVATMVMFRPFSAPFCLPRPIKHHVVRAGDDDPVAHHGRPEGSSLHQLGRDAASVGHVRWVIGLIAPHPPSPPPKRTPTRPC